MKKHYLSALVFLLFSAFTLTAQTPFASYPLDGNAFDVSGSWSGVVNGSPDPTTNRFSRASSALVFNGTTDYIDLPSDFDFPERTIIVWFNVSGLPGGNGNTIYGSDHAGIQNGNTYILVYNVGGLPTLRLGTGANASFETTVNLNTWYQAAIVRSPTLAQFYFNGTLVGSQANPTNGSSIDGVSHATIGSDRNHAGKTIGKIDDVVIYNSILSDTAILTNYTAWRDSIVEISGKMYFDANQNQTFDSTEQPIRNQVIDIGGSYMALTNSTGDYMVYADPGTYTVKPLLEGDLASFSFNPDTIVVDADSLGATYPGNDFRMIAPTNYCAGRVDLIAVTPPARPGFINRVTVTFLNSLSANAVSQTIEMSYPAQQSYVSATPAPTSVDTLNRIITWNVTNINSGTTWQALVTLYTPPTVAIGSILQMSASVSNSTCASLDSLLIEEQLIVVGSFDPNDKAVSPVGVGPTGRILPSTPVLNYTIRFQNTGTYLAENVNIIDTISPLLDLSTLKVLAASHGYEVLINGREVTFRFSQIMLPDSNANEPMSHGFIKYSIEPTSGFVQNSVITNRADIYFDFNEPIRTNTTQSTADISIGIAKAEVNEIGFVIYPNPLTSGNWQLVTDEELTGKELRIFDAAGRSVYSSRIIGRQTEIDASALQQGVYILRIENSAARIIKL